MIISTASFVLGIAIGFLASWILRKINTRVFSRKAAINQYKIRISDLRHRIANADCGSSFLKSNLLKKQVNQLIDTLCDLGHKDVPAKYRSFY